MAANKFVGDGSEAQAIIEALQRAAAASPGGPAATSGVVQPTTVSANTYTTGPQVLQPLSKPTTAKPVPATVTQPGKAPTGPKDSLPH